MSELYRSAFSDHPLSRREVEPEPARAWQWSELPTVEIHREYDENIRQVVDDLNQERADIIKERNRLDSVVQSLTSEDTNLADLRAGTGLKDSIIDLLERELKWRDQLGKHFIASAAFLKKAADKLDKARDKEYKRVHKALKSIGFEVDERGQITSGVKLQIGYTGAYVFPDQPTKDIVKRHPEVAELAGRAWITRSHAVTGLDLTENESEMVAIRRAVGNRLRARARENLL